jgi:hypothetical protein
VAGVALTIAITKLVDDKAAMPIRLDVLPYFVAYLTTLVPFYHGALRHLDVTYFEDTRANAKRGALMFDWGLLFLESCLLLGLAVLLQRPEPFGFALCGLLAFDCIWAFIAALAFSPETEDQRAESKWAVINFVIFCLLVLALLYIDSLDANLKPVDRFRWTVILLFATARTVWDYTWCWKYYYPSDKTDRI